jgi:hypothetical protein
MRASTAAVPREPVVAVLLGPVVAESHEPVAAVLRGQVVVELQGLAAAA